MVNNIGALLKVTAYVIFGIAFIGGIALGNTYKMQNPAFIYVEDLIFNWPLMIGTWIGCSISGILFLGIAEIIKLLQMNVNNTEKIKKSFKIAYINNNDELPKL